MTISLDLRPETEEVLSREASLVGVTLAQLLTQLAEQAAASRAATALALPRFAPGQEPWRAVAARPDSQAIQGDDANEWFARVQQIADASPSGPSLSDESLSSEGIYED